MGTTFLQIAPTDEQGSGARYLHEERRMRGEDAELWVLDKTSAEHGVFSIGENPLPRGAMLSQELWQRVLGKRAPTDFSAILLHGMGMQIPLPVLELLSRGRLFWLLEDCAPYTAGCQQSAHCGQWTIYEEVGCAGCPLCAGNSEAQEQRVKAFKEKRAFYQKARMTFLCQNAWQQKQLERSIAKGQPRILLPSPVDTRCFYPGALKQARRNLGLPENAFVLVFPADVGAMQDQVMGYVHDALAELREAYSGYLVLVKLGRSPLPGGRWPVDELREADGGAHLRAEYCRAANLQLWFSGLDFGYRAVREAGFCGLASVAFDIGAAQTVVAHQTGFCLPVFDAKALAKLLLGQMQSPLAALSCGLKFYAELRGGQAKDMDRWLKLGK